jgi:hypothetical protein
MGSKVDTKHEPSITSHPSAIPAKWNRHDSPPDNIPPSKVRHLHGEFREAASHNLISNSEGPGGLNIAPNGPQYAPIELSNPMFLKPLYFVFFSGWAKRRIEDEISRRFPCRSLVPIKWLLVHEILTSMVSACFDAFCFIVANG